MKAECLREKIDPYLVQKGNKLESYSTAGGNMY